MRELSPSAIESLWKRYLNHVVLSITVKRVLRQPTGRAETVVFQ
jgi:hypothetical protein